jgi:hypothetical protein
MSTSIKQAIDDFLLSCKVEGKSYGTIALLVIGHQFLKLNYL